MKTFLFETELALLMNYPTLLEGTLIKRYKRFFVDILLLNGQTVTAHCVNTGSMKGVLFSGSKVFLSQSNNPKRKLKYTLEIINVNGHLVGVNTHLTNKLALEALQEGKIKELNDYPIVNKEVKYGAKSRLDFLLENGDQKCFVEVKNVSMVIENIAMFPDSVSERGTKHLEELIKIKNEGNRSVMLFVTQREDPTSFAPAWSIDSLYSKTLAKAQKAGVEILVYKCKISIRSNEIHDNIPWDIEEPA